MTAMYQPYSNRTYRRDIQGIRAIGAILIMIYHLWMNKVSGGVDIFFVVSGFFMANILLAQLAVEGQVRPFLFWGKIIKRIAPAAYVVLVATLLLSYLFIPETQWIKLVNETVASAFHLENLQLMRSSVDYLARQEPPSPVQQFWALSIQMQFYFVLPIAFIFAAKLSEKLRSLYPLAITIAIILTLSFAYSIVSTLRSPDSAYFNPLARLWEFFAGVLVAVVMPYLRLGSITRTCIGLFGLSALFFGGLVIPRAANFPGYVALIPVGAAVCLIISGSAGATIVSRFLSNRYFTFLGSIAFTIYLWHWPLMVFYLESMGAESVTITAGLLIIVSSIILAYLTHVLIERRFSSLRAEKQSPLMPYIIGTVFFLPAATLAGALKLHFDSVSENRNGFIEEAFEGAFIEPQLNATTVPYTQFLLAKTDKPHSYRDSCHQQTARPEIITCDYGDTKASVTVALVGGSHATQWLPALDAIGEELNLKVVNITKSYCPLGTLANSHPSCVEWNKRLVDHLVQTKPVAVITNSTRAAKDGSEEHVPSTYVEQWQKLTAHGIKVIGIRDNPQFEFDVVHCVSRNKANPSACSTPRSAALLHEDPAAAFTDGVENLKLVDMSSYFCTSETCTTVFNDILMYRDREHISVSYAQYLASRLRIQLAQVSPNIFSTDGITWSDPARSE